MGPRLTQTSAPSAPRARAGSPPQSAPAGERQRIGRRSSQLGSTALRQPLPAAIERRLDSEHDMRRKRPPALSFALRMATVSRLARVVSLLALDCVGVALAIFTALILKAIVLDHVEVSAAVHETERILAFAYLLTALLFARSGLYAERAQRPGLSRIVGSLFQVAFVALIFGVVSGEHFSSYYLFYGSLAFALLYVSSLRAAYEWLTGAALRAAGYRRRAVLVGDAKHIGDLAPALGDASHAPVEDVGYLSADLLPAVGVRPLGSLADLDGVLAREISHALDVLDRAAEPQEVVDELFASVSVRWEAGVHRRPADDAQPSTWPDQVEVVHLVAIAVNVGARIDPGAEVEREGDAPLPGAVHRLQPDLHNRLGDGPAVLVVSAVNDLQPHAVACPRCCCCCCGMARSSSPVTLVGTLLG